MHRQIADRQVDTPPSMRRRILLYLTLLVLSGCRLDELHDDAVQPEGCIPESLLPCGTRRCIRSPRAWQHTMWIFLPTEAHAIVLIGYNQQDKILIYIDPMDGQTHSLSDDLINNLISIYSIKGIKK